MQFHSYSAKLQLPPRGSLYFRVKTKQHQWENPNIQMTSYNEVNDHSKKKKKSLLTGERETLHMLKCNQ